MFDPSQWYTAYIFLRLRRLLRLQVQPSLGSKITTVAKTDIDSANIANQSDDQDRPESVCLILME